MSSRRGQKWQRHRDSRVADVTAPPTVCQPQLVWVGPFLLLVPLEPSPAAMQGSSSYDLVFRETEVQR